MSLRALKLFCLAIMFVGCGSSESTPIASPVLSDAGLPDVKEAASVTEAAPQDAGVDVPVVPSYNACVTQVTKPTVYPRLSEVYCTDSLRQTYLWHLWDSKLELACWWRTTSDQHVRCVPQNEQSSPEYADETCETPIAMAAINKTTKLPDVPYIGLDTLTDAGSFVTLYHVGKPWVSTDNIMYYLSLEDGAWACHLTYLAFPGVGVYYLGSEVSPSLFQAQ